MRYNRRSASRESSGSRARNENSTENGEIDMAVLREGPSTSARSAWVDRFKTRRDETFCDCLHRGKEKDCKCGEDDSLSDFDWVWDSNTCSAACFLRENDHREVVFHNDYSCGTAGVRGTHSMQDHQYFWEIKMVSPVYGTDMMLGVGTEHMDLNKYRHNFCSMLGRDEESWGLSYVGEIHHGGKCGPYTTKFGQGAIIGLHLNMWNGTLSFYRNRQPLGVAFRGLKGKILYPMVSSTAARSSMRVISSRSVSTSLQFMCCQVLRKSVPSHLSVLDSLELPPGLKVFLENNLGWLLQSVSPSTPLTPPRAQKRQHSEEKGKGSGKKCKPNL